MLDADCDLGARSSNRNHIWRKLETQGVCGRRLGLVLPLQVLVGDGAYLVMLQRFLRQAGPPAVAVSP